MGVSQDMDMNNNNGKRDVKIGLENVFVFL